MKKNQENHLIGEMCHQSQPDSVLSNTPVKPVPRVQDIIGLALPRIGKFNNLDKGEQVVAVINDVSIPLNYVQAVAVWTTKYICSINLFSGPRGVKAFFLLL